MVQAGSLGQMGMTQARQVAGPIGGRTVPLPLLRAGEEQSMAIPGLDAGTGGDWWGFVC